MESAALAQTQPRQFDQRQTTEARQPLPAGPINASLHPSVIPDGWGQANRNCNTDRAVFELDKRYRQFQPALSAPSTAQGFGIGAHRNGKQFIAVKNGICKLVNTSETTNSDGTVSAYTTLSGGASLGTTGDYRCWQYQKWLFIANADGGIRYIEIGTTVMKKLYRNYTLGSSGNYSLDKPPYSERVFTGDSVAAGSGHSGGDWSIANGGVQVWDPWDPTGYQWTYMEGIVTFASSVDWDNNDYLALTLTTLGGNFFADTEAIVSFGNAGHATQATFLRARVKRELTNSNRTLTLWVDLSQIATSERSALTKMLIGVTLMRDGPDGFHLKPIKVGARYLQSYQGSQIDNVNPSNATDIEYAYTYIKADNTVESNATVVTLPGNLTMGEKFGASLPYHGVHSKISVTPTAAAPYDATSKIRIYRKVGTLWYRIDDNSLLNTGTPNWIDVRTADEVVAIGSSSITIGDVDPGASGEVKGIDFGCQWAGANWYFGNGKAYASRVNNFKEVLWDEVTFDNSTDAEIERPRTYLADPRTGQDVLAAVPNAAFYWFTRHSALAISGDLPALASYPIIIGAKGVVGPHAATALGGGALAAADDGLWFYEVPSFAGDSMEPPVEVTKDVRGLYATLIGSTTVRVKTCVAVHDDEIWLFCENRYLRRTREGRWIYGEYPVGKVIKSLAQNPEVGLCFMFEDGTLNIVGSFKTDGGTNAAGSNGAAATWDWTSKKYTEDWHLLNARLQVEYVTTPGVTLTAYSDRNPTGSALSFIEAKTRQVQNFPRDVDHSHNGGAWSTFKLSGGANDVVYSADVGTSRAEPKI